MQFYFLFYLWFNFIKSIDNITEEMEVTNELEESCVNNQKNDMEYIVFEKDQNMLDLFDKNYEEIFNLLFFLHETFFSFDRAKYYKTFNDKIDVQQKIAKSFRNFIFIIMNINAKTKDFLTKLLNYEYLNNFFKNIKILIKLDICQIKLKDILGIENDNESFRLYIYKLSNLFSKKNNKINLETNEYFTKFYKLNNLFLKSKKNIANDDVSDMIKKEICLYIFTPNCIAYYIFNKFLNEFSDKKILLLEKQKNETSVDHGYRFKMYSDTLGNCIFVFCNISRVNKIVLHAKCIKYTEVNDTKTLKINLEKIKVIDDNNQKCFEETESMTKKLSFIAKNKEKTQINFLKNNDVVEIRKNFISNYKSFLFDILEIDILISIFKSTFSSNCFEKINLYFEDTFFEELTKDGKYRDKIALKNKYIEILKSAQSFSQEFIDDLMSFQMSDKCYSDYGINNEIELGSKIYNLFVIINLFNLKISELDDMLKNNDDNTKNSQIINLTYHILCIKNKIEKQFSWFSNKDNIKKLNYENDICKEIQRINISNILQNIKILRNNIKYTKNNNFSIYYENYLSSNYFEVFKDFYIKKYFLSIVYDKKISYELQTYFIFATNISFILNVIDRYFNFKYNDYENEKIIELKNLINLDSTSNNVCDLIQKIVFCFDNIIFFKFYRILNFDNYDVILNQKKIFFSSFYYILIYFKNNIYDLEGRNDVIESNEKESYIYLVRYNFAIKKQIDDSIKMFRTNLINLIDLFKKKFDHDLCHENELNNNFIDQM